METALLSQAAIDTPFPIVVEEPVMWGEHRRPRAADQYKALVNARTGKVFSIVSKAYKLITHEEAIERVEEIFASRKDLGTYQTKTEFYNDGGRVRRTYTFPGIRNEIAKGDEVSLSLHLFNSYDRTWPFILLLGAFRYVCANGLVVGNKFLHIRRRHIFRLAEVDLEKNIKTAIRRFQLQTEQWQRMAKVGLSDKAFRNVMKIMRFGKDASEIIEGEFRKQADEITSSGLPIMTLWRFYNVLTAYITLYAVSLNHRVEMENRLRAAMERVRVPRPQTQTMYREVRPSMGLFIRNR